MRVCSVLLAVWLGFFQVAALAYGNDQGKDHHKNDDKRMLSDQEVEAHLREIIKKEVTIPTEDQGVQLIGAEPKGRMMEYTYVNNTVMASEATNYFNALKKNALPVLEAMFCKTEQFTWFRKQNVDMSWRYQASDQSDVALVTCQQKETCKCDIKNLSEK